MDDQLMRSIAERRLYDPAFTVYDAMEQYFLANPQVAIEMMDDYDGIEFAPIGSLEDSINRMGGYEAFKMGMRADIRPGHDWVLFGGDGSIRSISQGYLEELAVNYVMDRDFADQLINGELSMPCDLEDVILLWGPGGMGRARDYLAAVPLGSPNAKGRRPRR